ncbi:MAG TPA: glycosyl hydrolase family 18 protein [Bacteroidota bacterium]|nr:glycosyl hydrolase family 18 protein [Bacteroidota bacterium]
MKVLFHKLGCVLLLLSCIAITELHSQYRVVGYYPMWERTTLPATEIRFTSLTHIIHAFAWPNADGTISSDDNVVDTALINTTHRAGRKILLSYGGAGTTQTDNYATVTADSNLRKTFINNIVAQLSTAHYDGADLDWEGPGTLAQRSNEALFVKELRAAFRAADSSWLITMAIGASDWSGQWRDFATLEQYVDWFNAMEYDFHGSWSSIAGHNAPLNIGSDPNTDPDAYSIVESIQYLAGTRAIPKNKIVLGLPFYGKMFGTSTIYTSYVQEEDLAYRDIMTTIQSGQWTYVWDSGSEAPYYTSSRPDEFITLDDSASIAVKCQYVKTQRLSGVMIWEISQDVIGTTQPLMDVIGDQMVPTEVAAGHAPQNIPGGFVLYDNFPNPFNPSTTIQFLLPAAAHVTIKVFDVLGREVATLLNEQRNAGTGSVHFEASTHAVASGVYFYRIQAGSFVQTKKMILVQ